LKKFVNTFSTKNWKKISECIGNRTAVQCLHRWTKILKPGLIKGPWRLDEDKKLIEWVKLEGPHKWSQCAELILGRSGKQCRERWFNTLNPDVKKGNWSAKEDYNIFYLFAEYGSKWSKIAMHFPGRTENSVKNRFYSTLRRIASESKKVGQASYSASCIGTVSCVGDSEVGTIMTTNTLDHLIKYFPQAFEEKKLLFNEHKNTINELIKSPQPIKKFLGQKMKKAGTNNKINNTFNINVNISTPQSSVTAANTIRYENIKMNSLGDLGNMISNFSCEKLFDSYVSQEPICKNFSNNGHLSKQKDNEQTINLLLTQLNELESLLHNTKKQLFNYDTKKNFIPIMNGEISQDSHMVENLFKFEM
jgi:hypothetical protein